MKREEDKACGDDGEGGKEQVAIQAGGLVIFFEGECCGDGDDHGFDIAPEIGKDCAERADMDRDIQHKIFVPCARAFVHSGVGEDEMAAGADGEEFGDALD